MRTHRWLLVAGLAGCAAPLPSPSTVDVLRVLALTTATPEVRPGDGVAVRALWYDPIGGRAVRWRWRLCDPGVADDPRACARATGSTELARGEVDHVDVTASALTLSAAGGDRSWVIYAIACPTTDAVIDAVEGRLVCPTSGGSEVFRRVTVRATATLNRPPTIESWTVANAGATTSLDDGATISLGPLAACDGDCPALTLTLTPGAGAAESFDGGAESLLTSVYVTSGSVDPPRVVNDPGVVTPMVLRWTPARVVSGAEVGRVWALLRDQRGGETARAVTVTAL